MPKITVKLTDSEYLGILNYLGEDEENVNITHVTRYIQNVVSSVINSEQEAVSQYIKDEQKDGIQ